MEETIDVINEKLDATDYVLQALYNLQKSKDWDLEHLAIFDNVINYVDNLNWDLVLKGDKLIKK